MTAIISAAVIFVVFAVGDMISAKTKAIVSMLLVASVVFLAGFWTGVFPTTLFADSTLLSMAGLLVTMLLVHLGTTIRLRDFGAQWRTVIISAVACIGISAAVFFIGQLIIDRGFALVGAPILSGGVVATLTMQDMANKANLPDLAVFATLVLGGGHSIGIPLAVSARHSFIVPTATMTVHPVRHSGMVLGVPQTLRYFEQMQERIVSFVTEHSKITARRFTQLMHNTGELVMDMGTVLDGRRAVKEKLIDELGGLSDALAWLYREIERE